MRKSPRFMPLVVALSALSLSSLALAQGKPGRPGSQEGFHGVLGVAVVSGPEYDGAKKTRTRLAPLPLLTYRSGAFEASTLGGLRYWALDNADWRVALGLGFDAGRKDKSTRFGQGSDRLKGMGEIKASAELGLSVTWLGGVAPITFDLKTSPGKRGHGGTHGAVSTEVPLFAKDRLFLSAKAAVEFGDADYNQAYYGVSAAQASTSQFKAFKAGSGFNQMSLGLSARYQLTDKWVAMGQVGYQRALGDAAKSPLTERKGAPTASFGVGYVF